MWFFWITNVNYNIDDNNNTIKEKSLHNSMYKKVIALGLLCPIQY